VFDAETREVRPEPGYELIAVRCSVANGQQEPKTLWVGHGSTRTALTNTEGRSYPPIAYDFDGGSIESKELLPGARLEFVTLFSVPVDTRLKDLVFTLQSGGEVGQGSDVRVTLNP